MNQNVYDCNFIAEIILSTIIGSQETGGHQSQTHSTGKKRELAGWIVSCLSGGGCSRGLGQIIQRQLGNFSRFFRQPCRNFCYHVIKYRFEEQKIKEEDREIIQKLLGVFVLDSRVSLW